MLTSKTFKDKYESEGYSDYGNTLYAVRKGNVFLSHVSNTFNYTADHQECLLVSLHAIAWTLALACDGTVFDYKQYMNDLKTMKEIIARRPEEQDDVDYKASFYNLNERFNELGIKYQQQAKNHELHLKELKNIKYRFKQIQEAIAEITGDKIPEYDDY